MPPEASSRETTLSLRQSFWSMLLDRHLRLRAFLIAVALLYSSAVAETLIYDLVSRKTIEARLMEYAGDDQTREATLAHLFAEAGCDGDHVSEQAVKGSKLRNVICLLPGTSGRFVIVGAHFDHAPEGNGVVDNWSGASLLPSLYEAVKAHPHKHTYVFIGFASEEEGEIGSRFYVRQITREQAAATDAMVNMDTLGLSPSKVWATHSDTRLTGMLAYVAKRLNLPITAVNVERVGSTDSEQFAARKIPSITIHSLTQDAWDAHILHTSKDRISAIKLDNYYDTYCLLAAYVTYLDQFSNDAISASHRPN